MVEAKRAVATVAFLIGLSLALAWTIAAAVNTPANSAVVYVDRDAPGPDHDGLSWTTALTEVQSALALAESGDEIWVAEGVYTPGSAGQRGATFSLQDGVALYGGFAGTETARDQRDWTANITVLSGDIDGDDITDSHGVVIAAANIRGSNAYHVVSSSNMTETAVLDGFAITAGQANGSYPSDRGGGMYNTDSSPTVTNVTFSGNTTTGHDGLGGGGMYNGSSHPALTNVTFSGNTAPYYGGGMYNNGSSAPALTNVTFRDNTAGQGGGMGNTAGSNPTLTDVTFDGNTATGYYGGGGGMYNQYSNPTLTDVVFLGNSATGHYGEGGGMFNEGSSPALTKVTFSGNTAANYGYGAGMYNKASSNPTLKNVIFSGNHATGIGYGGGMYNIEGSSPTLTNVTFSRNTASMYGGAMYNHYSSPTLINAILWGDSASTGGAEIHNIGTSNPGVTYSDVQGGYAGTGNINANPRFVDAVHGNLRLGPGSAAIDVGDSGACPADDMDGVARPVGLGCDMGAYEMHAFSVTPRKSASHPNPAPGQVVTFTITLTNAGPGFTGGWISDTLPVGLHFVGPLSLDPAGAGVVGSTPPTLAQSLFISADGRVTVTFPVSVAWGLAGGTLIANTAVFSTPALSSAVSSSATLTVTNVGPQAHGDTFTVLENGTAGLDVLANDRDANGDALSVGAVGTPDLGGTALNGGTVVTYTPALRFVGTEVFTYTVSDDHGGLDTASVTVAVSNVNDAPAFTSTPVTTATENTPYAYAVTADDPDLIHGDVLTLSAPTLPTWLTLLDHGDGTAALGGAPAWADVGDHAVALRVTDRDSLSATQEFTVTVSKGVRYFVYLPLVLRSTSGR